MSQVHIFSLVDFFFLRFVLPNEKENMMLGSYEGNKEYDENILYENFNNDNFKKIRLMPGSGGMRL